MQLVVTIFVESKVWFQWIIDKAMLRKMLILLVFFVLPMTLLIFQNLVI